MIDQREIDLKENFKKYQVTDCKTLEDFLKKYYKEDRYFGRGEEYAKSLLEFHQEYLNDYGYDFISRHDSVTGRIVSFYLPLIKEG